ncbi:LPD38 domain-containing protein [Pseudaeromonas paramecii]|uniref:PLxRFG domain-containing protein n=1 Tax=Pseudaeromonas paramecii TaxID=2138166 RepID=A0ABP8PYD3_9GAMM
MSKTMLPQATGLSTPTVQDGDFWQQDLMAIGKEPTNLEVGAGDMAAGLAGSGLRGLGTGVSEFSLGDAVRAGRSVADGSAARGLVDTVKGWVGAEGGPVAADGLISLAPGLNPHPVSDAAAEYAGKAADAVEGAADWADNHGVRKVAQAVGGAVKGAGEAIIERGTSDDYKTALQQRQLFEGDSLSDFRLGDGAGDPAVWAAKLVDGIGSLGGTLGAAALTGGTVKSMVKRSMLKRGASAELAEATAREAGMIWGQRAAVGTGMAMSVGQSGDQTREQVLGLPVDQLMQSQTFREHASTVASDPAFQGATATQIIEEAQRRTADTAASVAKSNPATWAAAAAGTMMGDANLFKMLQGAGAKGVAAGMVQGALGEGLGEAAEEGTQQYVGNTTTNQIAGQEVVDPMSGVLQAAATAGTIGLASGGATGAIGGLRGGHAQQEGGEQAAQAGEQDKQMEINAEAWDRGIPSKFRQSGQADPEVVDIPDLSAAREQMAGETTPGAFTLAVDQGGYRGVYVDSNGKLAETPLYADREGALVAMRQNPTFWTDEQHQEAAQQNEAEIEALRAQRQNNGAWATGRPGKKPDPAGGPAEVPSEQQQQEDSRDIPAFLRQGDTAGRFKGFAEDSEVQRALAGEFGQSVQELVAAQMQSGDLGKTLQERVQAGELGQDPFAGQNYLESMAAGRRLGLPLKDVIFAGDANAKQPGTDLAEPGAFDDQPAGTGPQFRGGERTRWQQGQDGEWIPADGGARAAAGQALTGRTIEGDGREVGSELPFRDVVYGNDNRDAATGQEQASRDKANAEQAARAAAEQGGVPPQIGQSDTIFAGGEPGADSRNSAYTPPRLARDQVDDTLGEQSVRDPRTEAGRAIQQAGSEADAIFSQLKSLRITKRGQPFGSRKEAQLASRKTETPIELPTGGFGVVDKAELEQVQANQQPDASTQEDANGVPEPVPEETKLPDPARQDGMPPADDLAPGENTAPAHDAGVAASGPRFTIEPLTDKSIIVKGDKADAELRAVVEGAWPKAKPLYNEKQKGWVFSTKREGVVREALAGLQQAAQPAGAEQIEQNGENGAVTPAGVQASTVDATGSKRQDAPAKPAATGKLRDTGKTLISLGRDKENAPRQTNTPKRASQAASAIRDAQKMQADGETLIKIADAVDAGEAPHLAKLSNKAQYQALDQIHRRAIPAKHMEGGEYRGYYEGRTEQRRKTGVTVDDYADQIQYPKINAHPDHLRSAANALGDIRGYKGLAGKLSYAARLVTNADRFRPAELDEDTAKALVKAAKDTGNRDVKWASENVESGLATRERLRRMGIDNSDQLVAAIKELDAIQVPRKQESRLQQLERGLVGNKIPGYFNTQGEALNRVMAAAGVKPGDEVLEPSAGKGNIADAAKQAGAKVDTVERHNTLREILAEKGHNLIGNDFTQLEQGKLYDKVIMNPPFEQQQDIDHVRKAWQHVKPGGRLVAVMSAGVEGNSNRKASDFRQWLEDNGGSMERLPEGSFKASDRSTGVNTVMVVMDKPEGVPTQDEIAQARSEVNTAPSEAQKEAGNYKMGHLRMHGLDITLENPKGSTRFGTDQEGNAWSSTMVHDYGYIKRTEGADGDHVDAFIGDQPESQKVFVVDQVDPKTGRFDEHKVMLGFQDEAAARAGYLANYQSGWQGLDAIHEMPVEQFKQWLAEGDMKRPAAKQLEEPVSELAKRFKSANGMKEPTGEVSFSKHDGDPLEQHSTSKELELFVKGWQKRYKGGAGVRILVGDTQADLNEVLQMVGAEPAPKGQQVEAAYLPGYKTLLLNAAAIKNAKHARQILQHEVLAHHGLREVVGDDAYISIIEAVKRGKNIAAIKQAYYDVAQNYSDMHPDVQAEEVFAHWAENQPERGELALWWRGIVRRVKDALRAVGLLGERTTEDELGRVFDAIVTGMKNGRKPGRRVMEAWNEAPVFSKKGDPFTPDRFDARQFADEVERAASDPSARREISMGDTPYVLRRLGMDAIEMVMPASVVRKATKPEVRGHYVSLDVLKDLPKHLSDPIAVMRSRTEVNAFVSLIEATDENGDPVIVAIHGNAKGESRIEVNKIASVYGKQNSSALQRQLNDGLVYLDKTRAAKWLPTVRLQLPEAGAFQNSGSKESLLTKDDIRNSQALFRLGGATADDHLGSAERKLNLVPPPDVIDRTKSRIEALRGADKEQVKSWWQQLIHKANTNMLDGLAPIKYAEEAQGKLDASESGYAAARLATGSSSTMQATLLYGLPEWNDGVIQKKAGTGEADSLLGIFEGLGKDLHSWLGWMAGHRAERLMAEGRENLLTSEEIQALKQQGAGKEAKFDEAKAKWNRLNGATLDLAQEAGLMTKEQRDSLNDEWYIPFFRESEDGDVLAPFKAKGIANQSAGIKKLKGGKANVNDLLENIFTTTGKLIDASMKNMAAQKVVWNLAETDLIEVVPKPNLMDMRASAKPGNQMIWVKMDGEDYLIKVHDADLFRAMTMIDQKRERGPVMQLAMKAKHLLTAGVTSSPEFMLRNFMRDAVSAWAINEDGFTPLIDSIKGVKQTLKMNGGSIDMMFSGASFLGGYVSGNNPEAMASSVRKALRAKGMNPDQIDRYEKSLIRNSKQALDVLGNVWRKYERIGEAIENGAREAVYSAAIKAGKSHAQAAFEAKDLMDFSMLGSSKVMQFLVDVLPFFNARMQGLGKLGRAMRDNPAQIARRGGMIAAASLALLALNWDDDRYDDLPDWDKDLNWHFFLGDQHFRIPKPFEIGLIFGTLPERMTRAMGGKDTMGKFGQVVARNMLETFAINPIPQVVKPISEAYFNYDPFRGGPIDNLSDLNVRPEARYDDRTSLLMRELGELTGWSPKKLQHIVEGYTGTMGAYVLAAGDALTRAFGNYGSKPSFRADEIPLLRTVYQGSAPARSSQAMTDFYKLLEQVNSLQATINRYRKEGRYEDATELLQENRQALAGRQQLNAAQKQFRALRNEMQLIMRDRTLTAEGKRERVDRLLARRNNLASQMIHRFEMQ